MTEQPDLNSASPPPQEQPLDTSQTGDLSDPQMLDQMLTQIFAQLPTPPTAPDDPAIAKMTPDQMAQSGSNPSPPSNHGQSSQQTPQQSQVPPPKSHNGQSVEAQVFGAAAQMSSHLGSSMMNPILSQAQQFMSSLTSQGAEGAGGEKGAGGAGEEDMTGANPSSIAPTPEGFLSSAVKVLHQFTTLNPEFLTAITTLLDSAATEANHQGQQVPSQSLLDSSETDANRQGNSAPNPSAGEGQSMTGMGDLNFSEFLPDPTDLQHLFEQQMSAEMFTDVEEQASHPPANPVQSHPEVSPHVGENQATAKEQSKAGQEESSKAAGKTEHDITQPSSPTELPGAIPLSEPNTPNYYFLSNSQPAVAQDKPSLKDQGSGSTFTPDTATPEAATTQAMTPDKAVTDTKLPEHQPSLGSMGDTQGMTGMGDFNISEFLPDPTDLQRLFEQQISANMPTEIEEQGSQASVSEAKQHSSPMELPTAVPLSTPNTPQFYFLPNVQSTQSQEPAVSKESQPSSLPQEHFDVEAVRQDFPILHQQVNGKPLIWMDNAATSQKPQSVIDTISQFYEKDNSNVHRGAHTLAGRATHAYEEARQKVQRFLGASLAEEIVFVRGTTEAINLVAQTYGRQQIKAGDEIVLTTLEHHSNIVPWQMLAQEKGAVLKVAPISDSGEILLEEYEKLFSDRTRMVALSQVSNVLGTVLPIKAMSAIAHRYGAKVLVDGAQSVPHLRVNVQDLDADFFVFSGHKLFGPTGIGALFGKAALLEEMTPWQGGGNMIESVSFEKTTFNDIPAKFEAGTGNLADAVGLGAAIDYLNQIGFDAAINYEEALMKYATAAMAKIPGLRQIGTAAEKVSTLSFTLKNIPSETMGKFLDREGIAVRAGHHCAQPTMKRFGVNSTVRPSLAFYNTFAEVDALIKAIKKAQDQLT